MEQTKGKLKLFDLISIGVGSVVGAGIFSMLMSGMAMTGRSIALALVGAMLITLLQQVRSIFMSSMFALDGGMYAQQALILPPVFTGMTAVVFVFSNFSFSVFGISIAQYLSQLIPALAPFQRILGVVILTAFFLVTIKGTGFLAKIQNVLAVCMYAALALFIVFGLIKGGTAEAAATPYFAGGPMGFLMAIAIMSFTCNGATNVINLSADTHNPKRNIPLGVLISAGICALIYFLLGYVASSVVPFAQAGSATLGSVAQQIMPGALYIFFVVGGAIFALATSLLGGIAAISAPIVAGAEDGWLPKAWAKRTKNGYPWVVMLVMYLIAVVPAALNFSLDTIVSFILVPGMILNVVTICLSFKLPKNYPDSWAKCNLRCPYWLYCVLLVLSMIASLVTAVFSLLGLDLIGLLGNLLLTAFLFGFSFWRVKSGKVQLHSIESVKAET
ncbi:APC family permease [Allofournierella sp.]|uniref:APC family permease n=1 Tax=Allofournierella sp. TaxID=1940256 RepID=UPI003AB2EB5B